MSNVEVRQKRMTNVELVASLRAESLRQGMSNVEVNDSPYFHTSIFSVF